MTNKLLILAIIALSYSSLSYSASIQTLQLDRELSTEGFITISWNNLTSRSSVELQIALDQSFNKFVHKINLFNQDSVHLSGFKDGVYYARLIESNTNQVSNISSFTVKHRNLDSALNFFILGAALFLFLIATLFRFTQKFK